MKVSSSEQLAPSLQLNGNSATKGGITTGRVLVIDDEAAVGRTIQRLLGEQYDVVVVTAGSDAIDLLVNKRAEFDLILCDLTMPDITGMDVYTRSVEARADIGQCFVFMTGGTFSPRTRDFLDQVPNERLDKPFDLQTVRNLARSRVVNRI
ncbi:MAG TPA: response regulator [Polyangiaceae bacterium]|nr:response regulator [Polyangiaceae bacterium]